MSKSNHDSLRAAMSDGYETLARRLARSLGSSDLAREALHETYLRLDRVTEATPISSPADYLFRIAINVAKDRLRGDRRHRLSAAEITSVCEIPDESPDPAAIAEARLEFRDFQAALSELSARRQSVFAAAHIESVPHSEIAARHGINVRTVDFDLQHTMEHLSRRLGRKVIRRFGPGSKRTRT